MTTRVGGVLSLPEPHPLILLTENLSRFIASDSNVTLLGVSC